MSGEMPRCATCKWWQHFDLDTGSRSPRVERDPIHPEFGDRAPGQWGECGKVSDIALRSPDQLFMVKDASDYAAWLVTREEFGCVEWEGKDEQS